MRPSIFVLKITYTTKCYFWMISKSYASCMMKSEMLAVKVSKSFAIALYIWFLTKMANLLLETLVFNAIE